MEELFWLLIRIAVIVLCTTYCYKTAKRKNLNTTLAVVMGLLFSVFAAIYYRLAAYKIKKL